MAATPSEQHWTSVIAEEPMTLLKITQRKRYDGESEAQMMAKYDAKAAAGLQVRPFLLSFWGSGRCCRLTSTGS